MNIDLKIKRVDQVSQDQEITKAAAKGQMSLIERGLSRYGHAWNLPAIAVVTNEVCACILILKETPEEKSVTVALAWCHADIPQALSVALLDLRSWCREKGITEVEFTAHSANDDMAKAARAVRAKVLSTTYRVTVLPTEIPA